MNYKDVMIKFLIFILAAFIVIYYTDLFGILIKETYLFKIKSFNENINKNRTKQHVFIDLGANIGDSVKYFFTKNTSHLGENSLKGYALRENKKWIVHIVEANPYFNSILDKTKVWCESLGHTAYVYKKTAAWIRNEQLEFYLDTVNPTFNYWGSSLINEHPDVKKSNLTKIIVDAIDVSEILSKYSKDDEIVLKIDIEGTEYELLMHLILQNTLRLVDIIAIEFHRSFQNKFHIENLEQFYTTYFKIFNITYASWI